MTIKKFTCVMLALLALTTAGVGLRAAIDDGPPAQRRAAAVKAFNNGNFADAYRLYSGLSLDADSVAPQDFTYAVQCLQRLGRVDEIDAFRERAVAANLTNWKQLQEQSQTLLQGENYGFIIGGQFYRGGRRGSDGRQVNAADRDRVRALQLLQTALPLAQKDAR